MAPFVAFSIGSFGDILAVLQLLYKLRDALNELTGAAAEMRVLIDDIDRMARALIHVKAALERRASPIQPDIAIGIRVAVARCEDILGAALSSIERFKRCTTRLTGQAGWKAFCALLGWSVLGGKQRVDALRTRLAEQVDVIELYFALSQSCGQAKIQESLELQGATLRRLCDVVQDIQLRFDVGLPSFMFWDQANSMYCTPLARTSLDRLRDIYERYTGRPCGDLLCPPHDGNALRYLPLQLDDLEPIALGEASSPIPRTDHRARLECFIFQEKAFGQWQALVSMPFNANEVAEYAHVIKDLLERENGPRTPCTCRGESCLFKSQHFRLICRWFDRKFAGYPAPRTEFARFHIFKFGWMPRSPPPNDDAPPLISARQTIQDVLRGTLIAQRWGDWNQDFSRIAVEKYSPYRVLQTLMEVMLQIVGHEKTPVDSFFFALKRETLNLRGLIERFLEMI